MWCCRMSVWLCSRCVGCVIVFALVSQAYIEQDTKSCLACSYWSDKAKARESLFNRINQASIINCDLSRPNQKLTEHQHSGSTNKGHQSFTTTQLPKNMGISSKVSKLCYICGYFLILCYSTWITSSFVAADKHSYGSTDFRGSFSFFLSFIHSFLPFSINHFVFDIILNRYIYIYIFVMCETWRGNDIE